MRSDHPDHPEMTAAFHVSPCTILRLSGPDRERYLNGQVTQDVRLASGSRAVFSAVVNAKGQLEAVCHIREHEDSYLIDAPLELRESLLTRLERYIIADDVELRDESEDWHLAHAVACDAPHGVIVHEATRLRVPGHDWLSRESIDLTGLEPFTPEALRDALVRDAIPAWGTELTPGLLPPEAGLDRTAISYDKGCYIGQEVISRIKNAGKVNQHLVRLMVPPGTTSPCTLVHQDAEAGRITSVASPAGVPPETGGHDGVALGFRRRKFTEIAQFGLRDEHGNQLPGLAQVVALGPDQPQSL